MEVSTAARSQANKQKKKKKKSVAPQGPGDHSLLKNKVSVGAETRPKKKKEKDAPLELETAQKKTTVNAETIMDMMQSAGEQGRKRTSGDESTSVAKVKRHTAQKRNGSEAKPSDGEGGDAITSFRQLGLCDSLVEACEEHMKWNKPTPIQVETIPYGLNNRDVIALAQTGSGKTGAFALPILNSLLQNPKPLYAVVISPTRELALQIVTHFEGLGSSIGLKCAAVVGGLDDATQMRTLAKKPHVVVATPGRLLYHLQNMKGFSLRTVKFLVLDEADRLLHEDFEKELDQILQVLPRERQTFLFSATMTSKVQKLQRASLVDPVRVEVASKYQVADTLKQQYMFVPLMHKDTYLVYLLNELAGATCIIFTCTCMNTQRLALMLRTLGFGAIPIHGKMSQHNRISALAKFKAGERNILLATDVASRGLDIPTVDTVINYELPRNSKDYIHRVGRTARAGRSGRAITIVTQYDVELYQRIEDLLGNQLPQYTTEEDEVLQMQPRVAEAQRLAITQLRDMGMAAGQDMVTDENGEDETVVGKRKPNFRSKDGFKRAGGGGNGGYRTKKPRR